MKGLKYSALLTNGKTGGRFSVDTHTAEQFAKCVMEHCACQETPETNQQGKIHYSTPVRNMAIEPPCNCGKAPVANQSDNNAPLPLPTYNYENGLTNKAPVANANDEEGLPLPSYDYAAWAKEKSAPVANVEKRPDKVEGLPLPVYDYAAWAKERAA